MTTLNTQGNKATGFVERESGQDSRIFNGTCRYYQGRVHWSVPLPSPPLEPVARETWQSKPNESIFVSYLLLLVTFTLFLVLGATSQAITLILPYHYSLCTSTPVWRRLPSCPPQWCAPSSPRPRAPWDLSWSCRSRAARRRSASQSWSRSGATASPQSQAASGSDMPSKELVKGVVKNFESKCLGKKVA